MLFLRKMWWACRVCLVSVRCEWRMVSSHPSRRQFCDSASISRHQESIKDFLFYVTSTGNGGDIKFQLKRKQYFRWKIKQKKKKHLKRQVERRWRNCCYLNFVADFVLLASSSCRTRSQAVIQRDSVYICPTAELRPGVCCLHQRHLAHLQ